MTARDPGTPARRAQTDVETVLSLPALFASSFLAATLLPGGSEVVLWALLARDPSLLWPALAWATLGNTLGALTSYVIGRLFQPQKAPAREIRWLQRHGVPLLLLSWAPLVGDALCVAAGWLRMNLVAATFFIAVGKLARYWVVAQAALA
jgi:membrane protein YqaA with SNARE-associated domain